MSFDRALAGLAMGVGKGLVADAEARRAENLERLRQEFQAGQAEKDRAFRAGESAADRAQRMELAKMQEAGANRRAGASAASAERIARINAEIRREEAAAERAWREGEAAKARDHEKEVLRLRQEADTANRTAEREADANKITSTITNEDGTLSGLTPGGTAKPITGPDGQPVRARRGGDPTVYNNTLKALENDYTLTPAQRIAEARRIAGYTDEPAAPGSGGGAASPPAPAASAPPVGTTLMVDGQRMRFAGGDPSREESWEVLGGTPRRETPPPAAPAETPAAPARGFGVTENPAPEQPARPSPGRGGTRSGERPAPGLQPDQIDAAREQVVRNVVGQTGGPDRWITPDGQVKPEAQAQIEQMAANLQITPEQFVELLRTIAEEQ